MGVRAQVYQADVGDAKEVERMFTDFVKDFHTIDVLVNNAGGALKIPEGGFEDEEIELAAGTGIKAVSLGRRILRTETAGLMVLSVMGYLLETGAPAQR